MAINSSKENRRAWEKQYRLLNKEKLSKNSKKWKLRNPEKVKATWRRWESKNQDKIRNRKLKKYSLDITSYEIMFNEQGGVCKICNRIQIEKRLAVDHDHVSNKIRGLLCDNCNRGLGMFGDDANLILKAVAYLKRNEQ